MSTNLTVQIISLFMLGTGFFFGRSRWRQIDLIDVYILMLGIFFGAYSLIDACLNNLRLYDSVVVAWTLIWIMLVAGAIWILSRHLPRAYLRLLRMRHIASQWAFADARVIILLLSCIFFITVLSFLKFGIVSRLNFHDLDKLGISLPYWYTSTKAFVQPVLFCVFLASAAKSIGNRGMFRFFWSIVSLGTFLVSATYGRRDALLLIFMLIILIGFYSRKKLFSKRVVVLSLITILLLFIISNIFQNYRKILHSPAAIVKGKRVGNIINAALDSDATLSNLKIRLTTWKFNYLIINSQLDNYNRVPYGKELWGSVKNVVPKILWPGKPIYDQDIEVASLYKFSVTDYPSNNFSSAQADFGYLSIIFLPLQMTILFFFVGVLLLYTGGRHPSLCTLITGFVLQYLLNIEQGFTDYFILFRNIIMILVCYNLVSLVLKLLKLKSDIPYTAKIENYRRY